MWEALGGIFRDVGTAISGAFQSIDFGAIGEWVTNFVGNIGTTIKNGFDWITKPIKNLFGANSGPEAADALLGGPVRSSAVTSPNGFTEQLFGGQVQSVSQVADIASTAFQASPVQTTLSSGGLMDAVTSQGSASLGSGQSAGDLANVALGNVDKPVGMAGGFWKNTVDFFSTDIGQMLGKGAMGVVAMKMMNQRDKDNFAAARRESQRQEEVARRNWVQQENRNADLAQATRDYQQNQYLIDRKNKFAGVTGKMYYNDTPIPRVQ